MSHLIKKALQASYTVSRDAHPWEDNAVCTQRVTFSERRTRLWGATYSRATRPALKG